MDEDYRLATPDGVRRLIDSFHEVREAAIRDGNFDAIDMLIDFSLALEDGHLSWAERYAVELIAYGGWSVDEAAGIVGVDEERMKAYVDGACEKISEYLRGTEGYEVGG